jgi:hypothetical protein
LGSNDRNSAVQLSSLTLYLYRLCNEGYRQLDTCVLALVETVVTLRSGLSAKGDTVDASGHGDFPSRKIIDRKTGAKSIDVTGEAQSSCDF